MYVHVRVRSVYACVQTHVSTCVRAHEWVCVCDSKCVRTLRNKDRNDLFSNIWVSVGDGFLCMDVSLYVCARQNMCASKRTSVPVYGCEHAHMVVCVCVRAFARGR